MKVTLFQDFTRLNPKTSFFRSVQTKPTEQVTSDLSRSKNFVEIVESRQKCQKYLEKQLILDELLFSFSV